MLQSQCKDLENAATGLTQITNLFSIILKNLNKTTHQRAGLS